jgi:hypothetical protein
MAVVPKRSGGTEQGETAVVLKRSEGTEHGEMAVVPKRSGGTEQVKCVTVPPCLNNRIKLGHNALKIAQSPSPLCLSQGSIPTVFQKSGLFEQVSAWISVTNTEMTTSTDSFHPLSIAINAFLTGANVRR